MFADVTEWSSLSDSNIGRLILELVSADDAAQRIAAEALDYSLLAIGADRDENYGDPQILLKDNNHHLSVISVFHKILATATFNSLSKILALNLLYDIYHFANQVVVKEYNRQKAEDILIAIKSNTVLYQDLLTHKDSSIQKHTQDLLALLKRG